MAPSPDTKRPHDEPDGKVIDYAAARERKQAEATPPPRINKGAARAQLAAIVLLGLGFLLWYLIVI